ncbi:ubiquinol-cytochrome-c reductase cytochrome c1 [Colletotrichum higginsianum]|uniref:Ubiquinol-cytochrome-c reductase cytochrome c1 n=1 Tax=Colletotrichum higginsianum (strain IMI 349063) TaxID=759273 RepID=H1VL79_COLHI|nr:Ubiquinol-cytochrome-c reductase cytochrome c1 [Colletotrichum higginsianum IMI 349063]OBR12617.1 Ubiquinol-cytochrome-c reductase cytochrome c1 [Colletotrichum higginsianum IMI 349063]CCF40982.1 ubiquinol-cytochrome-c reductase cytochrome c1 [Colletotrichum higginsianum]
MAPGLDEKEVYLTLCQVFWGPAAQLRKAKKVEHRLRLCQQPNTYNPEAAALIGKYQIKNVLSVCQKLLRAGVFQSRKRAEARFPGILHPALSAENKEARKRNKFKGKMKAENKTVENETKVEDKTEVKNNETVETPTANPTSSISSDTIAEAQSEGRQVEFDPFILDHMANDTHYADANGETNRRQDPKYGPMADHCRAEQPLPAAAINADAQTMASVAAPAPKPNLTSRPFVSSHLQTGPTFLSYEAQHVLLTRTQEVLEKACFIYATRHMPQVLQARHWDVPECGELHIWARLLKTEAKTRFNNKDLPYPYLNWDSFFKSIVHLRHKAVHRKQLKGSDVELYLRDAEALTRLLCDDEGAATLARYREQTRRSLEQFEFCKKKLSTRFQAKMDVINARRAELDELERQANQHLVLADKEVQAKLGSDLKKAIMKSEVPQIKKEQEDEEGDEEEEDSDDLEDHTTSNGIGVLFNNLILLCRRLNRG